MSLWADRVPELRRMLGLGLGYADIGRIYGISRERVRQVIGEHRLGWPKLRPSNLTQFHSLKDAGLRFCPSCHTLTDSEKDYSPEANYCKRCAAKKTSVRARTPQGKAYVAIYQTTDQYLAYQRKWKRERYRNDPEYRERTKANARARYARQKAAKEPPHV